MAKKTAKPAREPAPQPSVAHHPRATRSVRRAKAWAGLIGFGGVLALSLRAGVDPFVACERALLSGIVAYLTVWAAALLIWRSIVVAEVRGEAERRRLEREAAVRAVVEREEAEREAEAARRQQRSRA